MEKLRQVETDMDLKQGSLPKVSAFTVYGFDIFNLGSLNYKTGATIGIPANFPYKSTEDIDRRSILVIYTKHNLQCNNNYISYTY